MRRGESRLLEESEVVKVAGASYHFTSVYVYGEKKITPTWVELRINGDVCLLSRAEATSLRDNLTEALRAWED